MWHQTLGGNNSVLKSVIYCHGNSLHQLFRIHRIFKKESFTLIEEVKEKALSFLKIPRTHVVFDLFANHYNKQEALYLTRSNSAFFYNWSTLSEKGILWANPPILTDCKGRGKNGP